MPIRSKAQWRKFRLLLKQGKITRAQWEEWTAGVKYSELPERAGGRKKKKFSGKRRRRQARLRRK
jgi:hypothetical protein